MLLLAGLLAGWVAGSLAGLLGGWLAGTVRKTEIVNQLTASNLPAYLAASQATQCWQLQAAIITDATYCTS